MDRQEFATARMMMSTIDNTKIRVPATLTATWQQTERVMADARTLKGDVSTAVTDALLEGRDPTEDPAVWKALVGSQLSSNEGVFTAVDHHVGERFRTVATDVSNKVVDAWITAFAVEAATLRECFDRTGPVTLDDAATLMRKGGDIAAVYLKALDASKAIEVIEAGWQALGVIIRRTRQGNDYRVLRLAAVPFDAWTTHGSMRGAKLGPWALLLLGLDLSLPTFDEYQARIAAITEGQSAPVMVVGRQRSAIAGREIKVPVQ